MKSEGTNRLRRLKEGRGLTGTAAGTECDRRILLTGVVVGSSAQSDDETCILHRLYEPTVDICVANDDVVRRRIREASQ